MFDTLHAYFFFGTSSSVLLVLMSVFVGGFRTHRSKRSFVILISTLALWSMADVMELLGPSEAWSSYWYGTVRTTAICLVNVSWLYFCIDYADLLRTRWAPWVLRVAAVVFTFYAAVCWTPWRSWIYDQLAFRPHDWLWAPHFREVGNLYNSYLACSLVSFLLGLAVLCNYVYRTSPTGRQQVLIVLSGFGFLAAVAFFNGLNLLGNASIDKTVFAFPVVVMALLTALFRHGFMRSDPILLTALMNHLPDRILVLDDRGYLSEANPAGLAWLEKFAKSSEGVRDKATNSNLQSKTAMHQRLVDYLDVRSQLGRFVAELPSGCRQLRLTTPQRQESYAVNVIALDTGERAGTLVTFRDETRTHHAMEDLKAYATTVAHDLKNPLTSIVACCDLLQHSTESTAHETLAEFVPAIQESAQSMNSIITDLLHIADLERRSSCEFQPVNIAEIAENVIQRLTQLRPNARIAMEKRDSWPFVLGHPTWLEMIMTNLVSNALEHHGGDATSVLISCQCEDEITFSITNQTAKSRPQATPGEGGTTSQRISNANPAATGTSEKPRGFGLSIVRRLVERQGGSFGMDYQEGCVRVWFRLHPALASIGSATAD